MKIYVCHIDGSGVGNTLAIGIAGVAAHLAHGDQLGQCGQSCSANKNAIAGSTATFNNEVKVYPNPATGKFIVQLPTGMPAEEAVLMDMNSRIIERRSFEGQSKLSFNLAKEPAGMYMIQAIAGSTVYRTTVNKQ